MLQTISVAVLLYSLVTSERCQQGNALPQQNITLPPKYPSPPPGPASHQLSWLPLPCLQGTALSRTVHSALLFCTGKPVVSSFMHAVFLCCAGSFHMETRAAWLRRGCRPRSQRSVCQAYLSLVLRGTCIMTPVLLVNIALPGSPRLSHGPRKKAVSTHWQVPYGGRCLHVYHNPVAGHSSLPSTRMISTLVIICSSLRWNSCSKQGVLECAGTITASMYGMHTATTRLQSHAPLLLRCALKRLRGSSCTASIARAAFAPMCPQAPAPVQLHRICQRRAHQGVHLCGAPVALRSSRCPRRS